MELMKTVGLSVVVSVVLVARCAVDLVGAGLGWLAWGGEVPDRPRRRRGRRSR
jgi:hypothetical protein